MHKTRYFVGPDIERPDNQFFDTWQAAIEEAKDRLENMDVGDDIYIYEVNIKEIKQVIKESAYKTLDVKKNKKLKVK